jgi:hypothetical protein
MSTLTKITMILAAVMVAATGLAGSTPVQKESAGVSGRWAMTVKAPHGPMAMDLVLKQEGRKVTGTFSPHGEDMKLDGEFADGTLKVATPGSQASRITLTAKLKESGTLEGYLSSEMGDMTWTAERAKEK